MGGKFGNENGYGDVKTGGLHGVGASCVQALSEKFNIYVKDGEKIYETNFEKGYIKNKTHVVGDTTEHGTIVEFTPDESIWHDEKPLDINSLKTRLKELAYLNPGLTINFYDNSDTAITFFFKEGMKEYVKDLNEGKEELTDIIYLQTSRSDVDIQIALSYVNSYTNNIHTFCNNIITKSNGDHFVGFLMGLNDAITEYMKEYKIDFELKREDIKEGLTAVVAVKVLEPIFVGQEKDRLEMHVVKTSVRETTHEVFADYLDKNPKTAKIILQKIESASKARIAALKARDAVRNNKSLISGIAAKLADCTSKNPEESEIFLVEGDSAAGSAKKGRNRKIQAILPVFGKIPNVLKKSANIIINSDKLKMLNQALKCGVLEDYNNDNLKYHKIIIMSDADIDGWHIACLWIVYFWIYSRPIIENGYLYLACPPRYSIKVNKNKTIYAMDEQDLEIKKAELNNKYESIQYLKGLGEMGAEALWDTTMNPENRTLIRITIDDIEKCQKYLNLCMDEDSASRKEWIMNDINRYVEE